MSNKVPQIRFNGYSDDWEERKLGEFVIDYVEKTTTQNQFPVLTSSQKQGIVLQETYFASRQVTTDNNIGYYVLPRGYFTFRSRSDNDVFVFNRNDLIDKGIISYFYPVFTLKNADSDFFLERINNGIKRQLAIQAEGTGQHVLSMKKFRNIISMFPSFEEQQKIGSFFKELDNLIAANQRKLDLLKEQKKGYLQKMFPKNGVKVPELRFAGFADDWEERKLNENVENIGTGRSSFKAGLDYSEQTPYEVLGSTSVISYSDSFDHSGNFVLTARVGANAGNLYKHSGNVKISDNTVYIQSKNLEFIFYLLTKYDLKKLAFGTGQPLIKASELKNLKLFFPKTFGEQQKIGTFFKQLDYLITLHQRKLDLLKEQKKGFLQKMFV